MLEVQKVIRCVLLCMLEAVEGTLCLLKVLEVPEVLEAMRGVPLCMQEAVEGRLGLLEALELMRCMRCMLCMLCTLYAGSCFEISIVAVLLLQSANTLATNGRRLPESSN